MSLDTAQNHPSLDTGAALWASKLADLFETAAHEHHQVEFVRQTLIEATRISNKITSKMRHAKSKGQHGLYMYEDNRYTITMLLRVLNHYCDEENLAELKNELQPAQRYIILMNQQIEYGNL